MKRDAVGGWSVALRMRGGVFTAAQNVVRHWGSDQVALKVWRGERAVWLSTDQTQQSAAWVQAEAVATEVHGAVPWIDLPRADLDESCAIEAVLARSALTNIAPRGDADIQIVLSGTNGAWTARLECVRIDGIPGDDEVFVSTETRAWPPGAAERYPCAAVLLDGEARPVWPQAAKPWLRVVLAAREWAAARTVFPAASTTALFSLTPSDEGRVELRIEMQSDARTVRMAVQRRDDRPLLEVASDYAPEKCRFPLSLLGRVQVGADSEVCLCIGPPMSEPGSTLRPHDASCIVQAWMRRGDSGGVRQLFMTHAMGSLVKRPRPSDAGLQQRRLEQIAKRVAREE